MEYFVNFPTIIYGNTICTDITRRPGVLSSVRQDPYSFAPYDVAEGERADRVADLYYGDESREWIVWLSASIIDPYSQWIESQSTFDQGIVARYGSIEKAQLLTHHYTLNWGINDLAITSSQFLNLPNDVQSLYSPKYDNSPYANILGYNLRREEFNYSTNLIMTLSVDNNVFDVGDYITFGSNGHAEICWSNSSVIKVQHVENNILLSNNVIVQYGTGMTSNVTNAVFTSNNIPLDLRGLFIPLSMYDYEMNRNAAARSVLLIDKKYTSEIEKEMSKVLL